CRLRRPPAQGAQGRTDAARAAAEVKRGTGYFELRICGKLAGKTFCKFAIRNDLSLLLEEVSRFLGLGRLLYPGLNMWAGNNFLVAEPRTDHRINAGIRIDHHLQKCRAVVMHKFL